MKNYYNISLSRLLASQLAHRLRKPVIIAYLLALVRPQEELQTEFLAYVASVGTNVNSQTCYMRGILNDEFDYYERRIKVRTVKPDFDSIITWDKATNKRLLIGTMGSEENKPFLLNAKGQIGKNHPSFEIVFPKGFALSEVEHNRIKTLVSLHGLASKNFAIVYE